MKSDLIDLSLYKVAETDSALCVRDFDGPKVWLPKSQIEFRGDDLRTTVVIVTLPEWLAIEKKLI